MNPENYLMLAAVLFSIGALGVLLRRNALVAFHRLEAGVITVEPEFIYFCSPEKIF